MTIPALCVIHQEEMRGLRKFIRKYLDEKNQTSRMNQDEKIALVNLIKTLVLLVKTNTSILSTTELIATMKNSFGLNLGNHGHSRKIFDRILECAYNLLVEKFRADVGDNFISIVADHGTIHNTRGLLNIIILYSCKETGDKKYFFLKNQVYKSKNREDTVKALNDILIKEMKFKPDQITDCCFDGGLMDTVGGSLTFTDDNSSKTVNIVHDFCHVVELAHCSWWKKYTFAFLYYFF